MTTTRQQPQYTTRLVLQLGVPEQFRVLQNLTAIFSSFCPGTPLPEACGCKEIKLGHNSGKTLKDLAP